MARRSGRHGGTQAFRKEGEGTMAGPKNYQSFAEFQREEIRADQKLGWSIDDLWKDAELRMGDSNFEERDAEELDFG
jgi:hypothetical protein